MDSYKFNDLTIILLFISSLIVPSFTANASDDESEDERKSEYFTQKSIMGEYVLIASGDGGSGGPETITGVLKFNGKNEFNGTLSSNTGAPLGDRVSEIFPVSGTYTIEGNGRGTLEISESNESTIFVVTESNSKNGIKKASKISFVVNSLSASGNLLSGIIKSRDHKYDYNKESLNGDYGFINQGFGGLDDAISIGTVNFDSETSIVGGDFTINVPIIPGQYERMLFDFFSAGPYTVNEDGTGTTFSETTGGSSKFIITKSESHKGRERVTEIYFVPEFLDPLGNFSPAYISRIDD